MIPGLSVVIVSWNAGRVIRKCLASLLDDPPARRFEILVLDNGSSDDSVDVARSFGHPVRLVELGENLGFAGACNRGYRLSCYEYLLFLNSDIEASPGALERLGRFMDSHPEAGAAGGMLLHVDGTPQKGFNVRAFPTVPSAVFEILLVDKLFPRNPVSRNQKMLDFSYSETVEVDQPAGACLLVRKSAFERLGLFDERFYPAWFEDVDLCLRLRRNGFKIYFVQEAQFLHWGGASLERLEYGEFLSCWYRNMLRYFEKHHGAGATFFLRALIPLGMMARILAGLFLNPRSGVRREEALAAYWRVMKETF